MSGNISETRFDPSSLGPAARLGWDEPGVQEYVALGMRTRKHRSVESVLIEIGSARRVANAIGLRTPFVKMSAKEVRALFVELGKRDNPRPYCVILRSLIGVLPLLRVFCWRSWSRGRDLPSGGAVVSRESGPIAR